MRIRIDIGLDFDGNHTFGWYPAEGPGAVDVPKTTLDRWTAEREAFTVAFLRWKRVVEDIEETLYRADHQRSVAQPAFATAAAPTGRRRLTR